MEIYKYLKFIIVWTLIVTGVTFMATLIFAGDFNGKYICINWFPYLATLTITNIGLNIYLILKNK